jgi:hypothetical protein
MAYKYNLTDVRKIKEKSIFEDEINNLFESFPKLNIFLLHRDFITKWLLCNDVYFEDFNEIEELISLTANYLNAKQNNNVFDVFFRDRGTQIKHKTLQEITNRNISRLEKVKEDLLSLTINGNKTNALINMIDDFISFPNNYIPEKRYYSCNVEPIRKHLNSRKIEIEEINIYINYFQSHKEN